MGTVCTTAVPSSGGVVVPGPTGTTLFAAGVDALLRPSVFRYSVEAETSSPPIVPLIVAGEPPTFTSRPACTWPAGTVTLPASASVSPAGYHNCWSPAP